jgi:hypothetical protein
MQSSLSPSKTGTSIQASPAPQPDFALINAIGGSFAIAFPAVVVCVIIGCRKYRATILQRRVHRLNRIWQLGPSKNLS